MYKITYASYIRKDNTDQKEGTPKIQVCYSNGPLGDLESDLNYNLGQRSPKEIGEIIKIKTVKGMILDKKP